MGQPSHSPIWAKALYLMSQTLGLAQEQFLLRKDVGIVIRWIR
jgi:hypothetical protein